jgi:hypothetical protein
MNTQPLSEEQFRFTFGKPMRNITGLEPEVEPAGVIDIQPYVLSLSASEPRAVPVLDPSTVSSVYRNDQGGFDHVILPCRRNNYYLVVVVKFREGTILGRHYLDLAEKYSLDR